MHYYFAYGSNMSIRQMAARCPQSRRLGRARLEAYRWLIAADGYATVEPAADTVVEGVLYEISSADEAALDLYEEVSLGVYTKGYLEIQHDQQALTALVYVSTAAGTGRANPDYSRIIREAVTDAGISKDYYIRHISSFLQA
jgi:gamma-glutamylcyclotransferase (GGCT)/AIG2-like uncharacterized protein YtfP